MQSFKNTGPGTLSNHDIDTEGAMKPLLGNREKREIIMDAGVLRVKKGVDWYCNREESNAAQLTKKRRYIVPTGIYGYEINAPL